MKLIGSLTSPYVRTWETAAELRDVLLPDGKEPEHCEWLAAGVWKPNKVCKRARR